MDISIEMLQSMFHDRAAPTLADDALEGILAHVRSHEAQGEKLSQLDLSTVPTEWFLQDIRN